LCAQLTRDLLAIAKFLVDKNVSWSTVMFSGSVLVFVVADVAMASTIVQKVDVSSLPFVFGGIVAHLR